MRRWEKPLMVAVVVLALVVAIIWLGVWHEIVQAPHP